MLFLLAYMNKNRFTGKQTLVAIRPLQAELLRRLLKTMVKIKKRYCDLVIAKTLILLRYLASYYSV